MTRISPSDTAASTPSTFALLRPRCSTRGTLMGMWKVPKRGEPPPTEDTLVPLDPEESLLRQWGTDPPLSAADWQLKSRLERYEALRKLAAITGKKSFRDRSRGPIQNELLKQKAVVEPPAAV